MHHFVSPTEAVGFGAIGILNNRARGFFSPGVLRTDVEIMKILGQRAGF